MSDERVELGPVLDGIAAATGVRLDESKLRDVLLDVVHSTGSAEFRVVMRIDTASRASLAKAAAQLSAIATELVRVAKSRAEPGR